MLPCQVRVDQGTMAMKGYSTIPKSPRLESCHQMVYCHIQDIHWTGGYPSAEMQSVYSTALAKWARDKDDNRRQRENIRLYQNIPIIIQSKVVSQNNSQ